MSRAQLSLDTLSQIYSAWQQAQPPLQVAASLRLQPSTVIAEYVRLDEQYKPQPKDPNVRC